MSRPVYMPSGMDELWEAMEGCPDALIFAGGTDALPRLRKDLIDPPALICLERIAVLRLLEERDGGLFIGAGVTLETLLQDVRIAQRWPALYQALRVLGSPHIRHMGTIGGNIVTASPAGDTLPPLYIYDAEVEIRSPRGSERTALQDWITGPGKTVLKDGEVLTGVWAPPLDDGFNLHYYEKVGQRNALAISVVSLATTLKIGEDDVIEDARLAWGSVGPTVVRSEEIEHSLRGKKFCHDTMARTAEMVHDTVEPIDDVRASADYRRRVAGNLLYRLPELWGSTRTKYSVGSATGARC